MKSPKKNGIGEVVTEYGARVMKVIKKGLLGRSLFDFYGDIKAQAFKTKESSSAPSTPADGKGGVIYTKSADGKLYYKSNEVSEVELSASDTVLTSEQVQDIVGAMVDGGTETNIAVTYDDSGGKLNFVSTDTNTTYSEATGSAEGLMSIAHHDKLDGIEASATADQTQADINGLGITAVGIAGATDGDVTITSDGEVTVKLDSDNDETIQKLKITNNADTEVASINESGELYISGDITNSGSDNDLNINSDGSLTFIIDRDNDEASQKFSFVNYTAEVANIDEAGKITATGFVQDGDLTVTPGDGVAIHVDSADVTDGDTSASGTATSYNHVAIENPRVIATNSSVTTTDASTVFIKGAPVAHTNQTITNSWALRVLNGASYFGGAITANGGVTGDVTGNVTGSSGSCTGQAATVATIAGLAPNTATTAASQPNITTLAGVFTGSANQLLTDDGDGTVTSESGLTYDSSTDTLQLTSTSNGFPRVEIKSNADTNFGQRLTFIKDRGVAPSDGDTLGIVRFEGEDSGQNATFYAQMLASIATAADGSEGGKITFQIASHDGEAVTGLEVVDGNAEDEVDVNIASGAGSLTTIAGDLTISGDLTIDGNNITNNASAANFNIASSRVLELQHAGSYNIQLGNSTNVDVLTVSGNTEEVTVNGTLKLPDNAIVGKQREVFFQNFFDDLGTTKHYLPFKSQSEQTTIYQEEVAVVMPCDGRIVSITLRVNFPNADGDITMGIHTRPVNTSVFTTADWVEEETETMPLVNADDSHVFHFAFDNAKHFESSELVTISMQCSADISTSSYWYVSTVIEYDWSTFLGTTSVEIESTP